MRKSVLVLLFILIFTFSLSAQDEGVTPVAETDESAEATLRLNLTGENALESFQFGFVDGPVDSFTVAVNSIVSTQADSIPSVNAVSEIPLVIALNENTAKTDEGKDYYIFWKIRSSKAYKGTLSWTDLSVAGGPTLDMFVSFDGPAIGRGGVDAVVNNNSKSLEVFSTSSENTSTSSYFETTGSRKFIVNTGEITQAGKYSATLTLTVTAI